MAKNELVKSSKAAVPGKEERQLLIKELRNVREELRDCPYVAEAIRVLPAKGYRSAIGAYWNAVVDDLRNKIIHRSLDLFNKEMQPKKKIDKYEDFQDHVTDHDLIEGAYKIGVISWEARKLLNQARETRNIFFGHPSSSNPSIIKVLNLITDCNKYVLAEEYPPSIIDISTYISQMDSDNYDRNEIAVEQAFSDLPAIYKSELANRFYTDYVGEDTSTVLRANIEFCAPILWSVLAKDVKLQIAKRFDKEVVGADKPRILRGLRFIRIVEIVAYTSTATRKIVFDEIIRHLEENIDEWDKEYKAVSKLEALGSNVPSSLIPRYVSALTQTFVGYKGSSMRFSRSDFYSDSAAPIIKKLFTSFDSEAADAFAEAMYNNDLLKRRLKGQGQLNRLRILGNILLEKGVAKASTLELLELLADEQKPGKFYNKIFKE